MAFVVIAGAEAWEAEYYEKRLRDHGYSTQVVSDAIAILRAVAVAQGRVDALVLIDEDQVEVSETRSYPSPEAQARLSSLIRDVRRLDERLAYKGGVRVAATPIVALTRGGELDFEDAWTIPCILPAPVEYDARILHDAIDRAIRKWREDLVLELDYVWYVVTQDEVGRFDVSPALTRKRREGVILTDAATPGGLRQNQFLMLSDDLIDNLKPYRQLADLLNTYALIAKHERIKPETVFQRFFERNPQFIYRMQFGGHFPKPSFRDPVTGKAIEPDFVLAPAVGRDFGPSWEILDLKLPDVGLVVQKHFHATLSQKLNHAIQQLKDYREAFNRLDMREQFVGKFGVQPVNARAAVLIGRRNEEDRDALSRLHDPGLRIDVLTYDDVMDFEITRLWNEARLSGLFN